MVRASAFLARSLTGAHGATRSGTHNTRLTVPPPTVNSFYRQFQNQYR